MMLLSCVSLWSSSQTENKWNLQLVPLMIATFPFRSFTSLSEMAKNVILLRKVKKRESTVSKVKTRFLVMVCWNIAEDRKRRMEPTSTRGFPPLRFIVCTIVTFKSCDRQSLMELRSYTFTSTFARNQNFCSIASRKLLPLSTAELRIRSLKSK